MDPDCTLTSTKVPSRLNSIGQAPSAAWFFFIYTEMSATRLRACSKIEHSLLFNLAWTHSFFHHSRPPVVNPG